MPSRPTLELKEEKLKDGEAMGLRGWSKRVLSRRKRRGNLQSNNGAGATRWEEQNSQVPFLQVYASLAARAAGKEISQQPYEWVACSPLRRLTAGHQ